MHGPTDDPLADVLGSVRLSGSVFFRVSCAAPWAAEAPPSRLIAGHVSPGADHVIEFHIVSRGRCLAGVLGERQVELAEGDVICFPRGDPHVLSSAAGLRAVPQLEEYERAATGPRPFRVRIGDGEPDTELVCGFLGCDAAPWNPLLAGLPPVLRASDREGPRPGCLGRIVDVAEAESRAPGPGGRGILSRLAELMFAEVVRSHLARLAPGERGWLAGLRDPHVGRALAALHAAPGTPWTLDRLARAAGLARSSLAERFADLMGEPPMTYLTRWRMQLAARLLLSTQDGLAAIGARVGYASEAAFNRAFKKAAGLPPAQWRRTRAALTESRPA